MSGVDKKLGRIAPASLSASVPDLSDDDVLNYLGKNPGFIERNPEALAVLRPPSEHDGKKIVDFQKFQVEKLQGYLSELDSYQDRLIAATRNNIANQQRIHEAALAALATETLEELIHVVTQDWRDMLDVDVVAIAMVVPAESYLADVLGVVAVENWWIDSILGFDDAAVFRSGSVIGELLYGPATPLVRAEAVARLGGVGSLPEGVLAFGTRDEAGFYPGQGTELLRFLTKVLNHCFSRYSDQWTIND